MSTSELACTYAALILHDDGIPITADKITTLVKAAGVKVEGYWPALFTKLFEKRSLDSLLVNAGSGGGGAPMVSVGGGGGGGAAAAAPAEEKVEEKKEEEPEEEEDEDMGFSLFD
eukprot:TRINITY_DN35_c0_g1_i1.p2 TRINITY_DN35_c0_g1~~TRINITY_DN35_c0_g1_i1.p2  ORF type:complete len:115 (+),score=43.14 TRINITY_DN35_c0_g1_i1:184-528(+)